MVEKSKENTRGPVWHGGENLTQTVNSLLMTANYVAGVRLDTSDRKCVGGILFLLS